MRHVTAICCLLLLLLTLGGRSLLFELRLAEVRAGMRRQVESGQATAQLEILRFSPGEEAGIHWLDGGDEFEWKDQRYDVVRSDRRAGLLLVYCIADKKEMALVAHYLKSGKENGAPTPAQQLLKLLAQPFIAQGSMIAIPSAPRAPQEYGVHLQRYPVTHFQILKPPPRKTFA